MRGMALLLFFSVAILGCKKKWTCDCTYEYDFGGSTFTTTTTEESEKITKKNAKEWCDEEGVIADGYSRSCELK